MRHATPSNVSGRRARRSTRPPLRTTWPRGSHSSLRIRRASRRQGENPIRRPCVRTAALAPVRSAISPVRGGSVAGYDGLFGTRSIVVAGLEKIDSIGPHEIHDAVLLRDATRPRIRCEVAQRLWPTDALKRITPHRLDKIDDTQSDASIILNPVPEIFAELRLEDRSALSRLPGQGRPRELAS